MLEIVFTVEPDMFEDMHRLTVRWINPAGERGRQVFDQLTAEECNSVIEDVQTHLEGRLGVLEPF